MNTWEIEHDSTTYIVHRCIESPNWSVAQQKHGSRDARVLLTSTDRIITMHKCTTIEQGMQWVDNWVSKTATGRTDGEIIN